MTERQSRFVEAICEALDIDFQFVRGMTVAEASRFIDEHKDEYYFIRRFRDND